MPQLRGSCGHVKGEWDSHHSCMSCTGCSPSSKCSFCQERSSATWRKAMNHGTFQSRKHESRSSRSCFRGSGSVVSGRSGESPGPRDFSPPAPDLAASGHRLSSPGPLVTGKSLSGPGLGQTTGHQSLGLESTDPTTGRDMTAPVTGQYGSGPVTGQSVSGLVIGHFMSGSITDRDMTVLVTGQCLSSHRSGCVRFGHRPFCVRFSHLYRLGPSGHQSGLWTPADWSDQHRIDLGFGRSFRDFRRSGCPFQDKPSGPQCQFGLRHYLLCLTPHHGSGSGFYQLPLPGTRLIDAVELFPPGTGTVAAAMRFLPPQGLAWVISRLLIKVPIITDEVIGSVLFLGVDPIAGHAIDRDDDTQGDLTPRDAELFRGIAEIGGVNYPPGVQGDQDLLGDLR